MGNIRRNLTFYLFSEPSFIEGVARVFDFGGTLQTYNSHETESEADSNAISNDWKAVGLDIKDAIEQYERAGVK